MSWRHWFGQPRAPAPAREEGTTAPGSDDGLLAQARALRDRGDRAGALALLDAALGEAHQPALVHHEMGTTLREVPDLPAAEASFSLAVELDPLLGAAWLRLGEIQARFERYAEAQVSLERARGCVAGDLHLETTLLLAKVLGRRERFAEALALYRQAMEAEPQCAEAFMGAATMELRLARDEAAIELFDQGLALNPKLRDAALLDLSSAYRQVGRWQEALEGFESASRRGPVSPLLRWYLSQTRLALCDWARGWGDYGSRFASGAVPYRPLAFRNWEGQPIPNQTLVILAEQGLGTRSCSRRACPTRSPGPGTASSSASPGWRPSFVVRSLRPACCRPGASRTGHGWRACANRTGRSSAETCPVCSAARARTFRCAKAT